MSKAFAEAMRALPPPPEGVADLCVLAEGLQNGELEGDLNRLLIDHDWDKFIDKLRARDPVYIYAMKVLKQSRKIFALFKERLDCCWLDQMLVVPVSELE